MKRKTGILKNGKKINQAVIIVVVIVLLAVVAFVAGSITGQYKNRAPRYSFAFFATGLTDGSGNIIDIHGGGKFSPMAGWGWGPSFWYWNVWIDAKGSITFITAGEEEIKTNWKSIIETGLYDQLVPGVLNFTLRVTGQQPSWITAPIAVTLIEDTEKTSGYVILNTGTSTYTGIGTVVIH